MFCNWQHKTTSHIQLLLKYFCARIEYICIAIAEMMNFLYYYILQREMWLIWFYMLEHKYKLKYFTCMNYWSNFENVIINLLLLYRKKMHPYLINASQRQNWIIDFRWQISRKIPCQIVIEKLHIEWLMPIMSFFSFCIMVKVFNSSIMEIQMSDVREKLGGKRTENEEFFRVLLPKVCNR